MNQTEQALRTRLETGDFQTNFLVEAGAGAGKSHTICRRILHQLLAGQAPGSIAAITFTEKATLELQEKLDRQALDYDRTHGTRLADLAGQVHVSTIHSFCETALRLFPLESGCGLDFQVLEDGTERADAFFRRRVSRDPAGAAAAFERFGGRVRDLEDTFRAAAGDGVIPAFLPPGHPDFQSRRQALAGLLDQALGLLRKHLLPCRAQFAALPEGLAQAVLAPQPDEEQLRELKRTLLSLRRKSRPGQLEVLLFTGHPPVRALLERYLEASKKKAQREHPEALAGLPPIFAAADRCREELGDTVAAMQPLEQSLGHDLAMAVVAPAVRDYLAECRASSVLSFSGLLTAARDLVRDVPDAREALRRRFRVFYVDEFQDTDPVQAELLFLLTHRDADGERDWRRCRPAPGSLFLVGDPKQAIYRFRGADLDVYKQVKARFTDPADRVGEVVALRANFRSNPRICAYADQVFAPRDPSGNILTPAAQAANRDCEEVTGLLDDGRYQSNYVPMEAQQGDPGRPAVFSYPAVLPGDEPDDALRVARFIRRAAGGGYTLPDRRGRAVPVRYGDFLLLTRRKARAERYLEALSALGVPVSFNGGRPLDRNPQLRRLEAWLRWLLEPDSELKLVRLLGEEGQGTPEGLRRLKEAARCPLPALVYLEERRSAAAAADPALGPLLAALEGMSRVLADSRALPPGAFLEKLAEERLFRAEDAGTDLERRRQYSDVRQVLLRARQYGGLPQAARAVLALRRGSLERDLPLSPEADAVRVMNLHKAKGLEGKVVLLLSDSCAPPSPRKAQGVYAVTRSNGFGGLSTLYTPAGWDALSAAESKYLQAEQVRLNYVAATRAEQLLLVARDAGNRREGWADLARQAPPVPVSDPQWGDFFLPLASASCTVPPVPVPPAPPVPDLTALRAARIEAQSRASLRRASPSALDKSHPAPSSLDPEEGPALERDGGASRGADWGTAVHRLMELCVSRRVLDPAAALPLARQALAETVPPFSRLTGEQRRLLFGSLQPRSDGEAADLLADRLRRAADFWFDAASPLRRLAEAGTCYCELPFHLRLSDPSEEIWQFVRQRLEGPPDPGGALILSGILDLAVLTAEGWHIIDYKTDLPRPGETADAYRRRLAGEYGAQLSAYRGVLARLSGRPVLDAHLCAIPLGGELIGGTSSTFSL